MDNSRSDDRRRPVVVVNGTAVAALVLGVVGVAAAFIPVIGVLLGGVLGLAGVVTGVIARRQAADDSDPRHENLGLATGGIVSSTLALIVVLLQIVGIVTLTGLTVENFDERVGGLGELVPGISASES